MSRVDILSSLNLSASEGVLAEDLLPPDLLPAEVLPDDLPFPEDLPPADVLAEDLFLAASFCFADAAGFFCCCWASEVFWAWASVWA